MPTSTRSNYLGEQCGGRHDGHIPPAAAHHHLGQFHSACANTTCPPLESPEMPARMFSRLHFIPFELEAVSTTASRDGGTSSVVTPRPYSKPGAMGFV